MNDDMFKKRLEDLPLDFYFNNKEHFFCGCKKIIANLGIINANAIAPTLEKFCFKLFEFTVKNLENIEKLRLKYPTEVYSMQLRFARNAEELIKAIKYISIIISDYNNMFKMTFTEIENSDLKKYFEPKRFNKSQKKLTENRKKKDKLLSEINTTLGWNRYHIDIEKLINSLCNVVNSSGVYRIYNYQKEIIYIGKSYNLASRIPSSLKERKGCAFDYTIIDNKADTDIYEIYYISKLQPILNVASNNGDKPTVTLPELKFCDIVETYTDKVEKVTIYEYDNQSNARILFKQKEQLEKIIKNLSEIYDIKSISKLKQNEYDKDGNEFFVSIQMDKKLKSENK